MHPTTKPSPPGLSHIPLHTPQPRGWAQLWVLGQARGALPGRPQILLRANSRSWGAGWLFLLCATIFLCPLRFPPPPGASAGGWAQLPRVQHPRAQLPRPPPRRLRRCFGRAQRDFSRDGKPCEPTAGARCLPPARLRLPTAPSRPRRGPGAAPSGRARARSPSAARVLRGGCAPPARGGARERRRQRGSRI